MHDRDTVDSAEPAKACLRTTARAPDARNAYFSRNLRSTGATWNIFSAATRCNMK